MSSSATIIQHFLLNATNRKKIKFNTRVPVRAVVILMGMRIDDTVVSDIKVSSVTILTCQKDRVIDILIRYFRCHWHLR